LPRFRRYKTNAPLVSVIIPTLNEEHFIGTLLIGLKRQTYSNFEVIVVDGGEKGPSSDATVPIAKSFGARTLIRRSGTHADARNVASSMAAGEILIFTEADTYPPPDWLTSIVRSFRATTIAVAGPGIPLNAPRMVMLEYAIYNALRAVVSRLPRPLKHFSSSAYNVAIRRQAFEKIGGFSSLTLENIDGLLGRRLLLLGKARFSSPAYTFISTRRWQKLGFIRTNLHYIYVLENFINLLEPLLKPLKERWYRF